MPRVGVPGVNLNETQPWDGEANMLPPGEYAFQVDACALGNSSGGNPQLEFDLSVVAGADTDAFNGTGKKKHWVVMTEKSAGRVRQIVDACGVPLAADGTFATEDFVGTSFIGEVFEDSYEKDDLATGGKVLKTNNKIRKERPVSDGWSDISGKPAAAAAPRASAPATAAAPAAATAPVQAAPAARAPAPRAPANALPPGPRVAGAVPRPGVRAPIPGRRQN